MKRNDLTRRAPTGEQWSHRPRGFALVLTLSLLALLVLAVLALSALTKVNAQIAAVSVYQTQARQNALLGFSLGLGELQRQAGADTRLTGMAGITGIAANAANSTRHWCGVWEQANGAFVGWLVSGAQAAGGAAVQSGLTTVELIGANTVGAAAANSEHVIAGKLPIVLTDTAAAPGVPVTVGSYAWLVIDEGVKISAYAPASALAVPGIRPLITSTSATAAAGKLRTAVDAYAARLPAVISYEQLSLLPTPAAALTASVLQDNFHQITLTDRLVSGSGYFTGTLNVNTTSAVVWRSFLETYNSVPAVPPILVANLTSKGNTLGNGLAASTAGKAPNGPFTSVAAFGTYLATVFPANGTPTGLQILNATGPMLAVRSDTFRVRGYGEAVNPSDATRTEATAWCEAIVQRTPDAAANGLGRKFVVIYFRWLGPEDI
jgi:hypothetical protein